MKPNNVLPFPAHRIEHTLIKYIKPAKIIDFINRKEEKAVAREERIRELYNHFNFEM